VIPAYMGESVMCVMCVMDDRCGLLPDALDLAAVKGSVQIHTHLCRFGPNLDRSLAIGSRSATLSACNRAAAARSRRSTRIWWRAGGQSRVKVAAAPDSSPMPANATGRSPRMNAAACVAAGAHGGSHRQASATLIPARRDEAEISDAASRHDNERGAGHRSRLDGAALRSLRRQRQAAGCRAELSVPGERMPALPRQRLDVGQSARQARDQAGRQIRAAIAAALGLATDGILSVADQGSSAGGFQRRSVHR